MPKKKQRFSKGHEIRSATSKLGLLKKDRGFSVPKAVSTTRDVIEDVVEKATSFIPSRPHRAEYLKRRTRREDMRRKRDKANTEVDSSPLNKRKPNPLSAISDAFSRYLPKHKKKKK